MRFGRFALWALAVTALLVLLGPLPTRSWWPGSAAVEAMRVGCGLSLLASLAGGLVLRHWPRPEPGGEIAPMLAALAVRVATLLGLALAAALAGPWPRPPLLVWVALSHLALLPLDSVYAVRTVRRWTAG